jgi:uncharacterized protein involved in exopolysaccharide biosynthesis
VAQEGDEEIVKAAEKVYEQARARRDEADLAWSKANAGSPVEGLAAETEQSRELKSRLERQRYQEDVASAEYADRAQALGQGGPEAQEARAAALEARAAKVRAQNLRSRIEQLDQETRRLQAQLQQRTVEIEQLEARRKAAQTALDAAEARVREARASAGARGERLRLIDPGIVPERRSSPNITLNVMAAWLLATVAAAAYLALEFSYRRRQAEDSRHTLHAARHRE